MVNRECTVATLAQQSSVDVDILRADHQLSVRQVQPSQCGFICPVYSPENESAGILKAISITPILSRCRDHLPIIAYARQTLGISMTSRGDGLLIICGIILGLCDTSETLHLLRGLKLKGQILSRDASVVLDTTSRPAPDGS